MMQPGRDSNFPTSSGTLMNYAPHGLVGIAIAIIVILILIHLLSGGKRRR